MNASTGDSGIDRPKRFQGKVKLHRDNRFYAVGIGLSGVRSPCILSRLTAVLCGWSAWRDGRKTKSIDSSSSGLSGTVLPSLSGPAWTQIRQWPLWQYAYGSGVREI